VVARRFIAIILSARLAAGCEREEGRLFCLNPWEFPEELEILEKSLMGGDALV
jgi:hypothetical protein